MEEKRFKPEELMEKTVFDKNQLKLGVVHGIEQPPSVKPNYVLKMGLYPEVIEEYGGRFSSIVPVPTNEISTLEDTIVLGKSIEELSGAWSNTTTIGNETYMLEELTEKPVFDRNYIKLGTIREFTRDPVTKSYNTFKVELDPIITEKYVKDVPSIVPVDIYNISWVKDTVILNKSVQELGRFWHETTTE
jgi:sporulation protein YlmC with PRC-barrel domain